MQALENILRSGGVGVLATDTLYGVVGQALNKQTVERIYGLKKRRPNKPFIILISSLKDIALFGVRLDKELIKMLDEFWPGPVSIILTCDNPKFEYLHRGSKSLAFRLPARELLRKLIAETGPLVAPSANPEGLEPASNIKKAEEYFGDKVDFYQEGKVTKNPSKLIEIQNNKLIILRP